MDLLKKIEAFEKEVTTIELDITEKVDDLSKDKEVCQFMTATKYASCGIPLTFMDSIRPTYKAQLDAMTVGIYQDALMMNLKEIEGVWDRLSLLQLFLDKNFDKVSEHLFKRKEYYPADFFSDVLMNFTIETKWV